MEPVSERTRSFEQMLEEGAGGLSGPQCVELLELIVLRPSTEVGWTAEAWAPQVGSTPEVVRRALRELTEPCRRRHAARRRAESTGVEARLSP